MHWIGYADWVPAINGVNAVFVVFNSAGIKLGADVAKRKLDAFLKTLNSYTVKSNIIGKLIVSDPIGRIRFAKSEPYTCVGAIWK